MNYAYNSILNNKVSQIEFKKIESIKEIINKSNARNISENWRKHVPVYGWTKMNYPTTICPPISEKYIMRQKQLENNEAEKSKKERLLLEAKNNELEKIESPYCPHNKWRLNPEKVNEDVLKESNLLRFKNLYKLIILNLYSLKEE